MLSKAQTIYLMDMWRRAARVQGWAVADRRVRLRVLGEMLGREIGSTKEIEPRKEFDRLKARLLAAADQVKGAAEVDHPELGQRRRWLHVLGELLVCLRVYKPSPAAEAIVRGIIQDKAFSQTPVMSRPLPLDQAPSVPGLPEIDLLSVEPRSRTVRGNVIELPCELEQLVMTLSRVLNGRNGYRAQAGDTMHDMRVKARLRCGCRRCVGYDWSRVPERAPAEVEVPF